MPAIVAIAVALAAASPEQRALDYLTREVPRWSAENRCFSCHNNGDGARALYIAIRLKRKLPAEVLADTTEWPLVVRTTRALPAFGQLFR